MRASDTPPEFGARWVVRADLIKLRRSAAIRRRFRHTTVVSRSALTLVIALPDDEHARMTEFAWLRRQLGASFLGVQMC